MSRAPGSDMQAVAEPFDMWSGAVANPLDSRRSVVGPRAAVRRCRHSERNRFNESALPTAVRPHHFQSMRIN